MKVLIVDDEREVAKSLRDFVESSCEGWEVTIGFDSSAAIQVLESQKFEAVIADQNIEYPSAGFKVLEVARRAGIKKLAMISGNSLGESLALLKGYGYFIKPKVFDDIKRFLHRSQEG